MPQLTPMWKVLELGVEESDEDEEFTVSPYEMLPASPAYSHYMGSLTTPPCTEVRGLIILHEFFFLNVVLCRQILRNIS